MTEWKWKRAIRPALAATAMAVSAAAAAAEVTPLHKAAEAGHENEVRELLEWGADPNAKDYEDRTPLHYAARGSETASAAGLASVVLALLEWQAIPTDPNAKDYEGRAPLHFAALRGRVGVVAVLLLKGANPNAKDQEGQTPLDLVFDLLGNQLVAVVLEAAGAQRSERVYY